MKKKIKAWEKTLRAKYPKGVHTSYRLAGTDWVGECDQVPWLNTFIKGVVNQRNKEIADAAEMLWVCLANVNGSDWTKQNLEWQKATARWRDNYFKAIAPLLPPSRKGKKA